MFCRVAGLALLLCVCVSAGEIIVKNLAGPPSDFALNALPSPLQGADIQNSATFNIHFGQDGEDARALTQVITLPVDSKDSFRFTFYSNYEKDIKLSLKNPAGHAVTLHGVKAKFPIGDLHVDGTDYTFKKPKLGNYVLTLKTKALKSDVYEALTTNVGADAVLILWNEDALATHTYLNTYSLLTGNQVGLITRVFDSTTFSSADANSGLAPVALKASIQEAEMIVELPNGTTINQPMFDNGSNADEAADDGVYGSLIIPEIEGDYIFSATVRGLNNGVEYVRTTQQVVTIIKPKIALTGVAVGILDLANNVMNIQIAATAPLNNKYRAYAEVWGVGPTGSPVAIAWIAGMTSVKETAGITGVSLQLNLNWIFLAGTHEPLTLKNVVIQDALTFVPVSTLKSIPVKSQGLLASVMSTQDWFSGEITPEMREGKRPQSLEAKHNVSGDAASAAILLVHGYCTDKNPFLAFPAVWTNAHFYLNPLKNHPHDTFALQVLLWADTFGAFSYVGHSQGGAVGLHIKNYYWSGLDLVSGGRILQSVGTPYQGSSGAGTAANLAKLFGVTCGANVDLTKDGAALWLKGITPANRALVSYYTTTYPQGKLLGDYCNLITQLVLAKPNDGVAEELYSQLPGAQNQGNVQGYCHSIDMKYPAQTQNLDRNAIMNSLAARDIIF